MTKSIHLVCCMISVGIISLWATDIKAKSNVNPTDMKQAEDFIAKLPPACEKSTILTAADGTVKIILVCKDNDQSTDGIIEIKNGIIKKIR